MLWGLYLATAAFAWLRLLQAWTVKAPLYRSTPEMLWPFSWTELLGRAGLIPFYLLLLTMWAGLLLMPLLAWWHRSRGVRIAIATIYTLQAAYAGSFGKVSHADHMLLWTLIVFATVPTSAVRGGRLRDDWRLLRGVWHAQVLVATFYFLSGSWKVLGGLVQLLIGEANLFRLDAMPRQIAARLSQTAQTTPVGEWLIDHPLIATPLLWAAVALELAAILLPCKPRWQRAGGLALLALHVGIGLAMTIWFDANLVVLLALFVFSPLAVGHQKTKTPPRASEEASKSDGAAA